MQLTQILGDLMGQSGYLRSAFVDRICSDSLTVTLIQYFAEISRNLLAFFVLLVFDGNLREFL